MNGKKLLQFEFKSSIDAFTDSDAFSQLFVLPREGIYGQQIIDIDNQQHCSDNNECKGTQVKNQN